jgi:hypothetical protein
VLEDSARADRLPECLLCESRLIMEPVIPNLGSAVLRVAGLLEQFPASPMVIDQWELKNVFTPEFREAHTCRKKRADFIRRDREAFWSTGVFDPPNYIPPRPPITEAERAALEAFLSRFEQVYSCIPPGGHSAFSRIEMSASGQ